MFDSTTINNTHIESSSSAQAFREDEAFIGTHPWVRHYEQGVPTHIDIPAHPLTWLLDQACSRYPEHTAFIYYGTKLTYAQFARYAQRFASELQQLGVRKGDWVAIALPNIPQYPMAFYGALRAEAAVAGSPDAYRGEKVAAFVVLKPGVEESEKTRQELIQLCKQGLTAYKVPKILEFRNDLPKTLIGKVLRRELRVEKGVHQAGSSQ